MQETIHRTIGHIETLGRETMPNSFEGFSHHFDERIECDVMLTEDGLLANVHPKDVDVEHEDIETTPFSELDGSLEKRSDTTPVSYTHLTLPTTPYV